MTMMDASRRAAFESYLAAIEGDEMSRRSFMKLLGASAALAGIESCTRMPDQPILPYVNQPELTPGVAQHYATSMTLDGHATGLIIESHEGRPTKVDGNPEHPASLGAAGLYEQASVLQLYDPQRARHVRRGGARSTWQEFAAAFRPDALRQRVGAHGERLRLLLEPTSSPLDAELLARFSALYPAAGIHFYAPLATPYVAGQGVDSDAIVPQCDVSRADVIVAVDTDFLATGPFHLRHARAFAAHRRGEGGSESMNRLYAIEPSVSVTGMAADHRLAIRPGEIEAWLAHLLDAVDTGAAPDVAAPASDTRFVRAIAGDLLEHRSRSLIIGGPRLGGRAHALIRALNDRLGNVGATVWFTPSPIVGAGDPAHTLAPLVDALAAGAVDTIICIGGNAAYASAGSIELERLLRAVPNSAYAGLTENETARACAWMIPTTHYLESWADARAYDGTLSIVQPLIAPMYGGHTTSELLSALLGDADRAAFDLLRESWSSRGLAEDAWRETLGVGLLAGTSFDRVIPPPTSAPMPVSIPRARGEDHVELVFAADASVHDGCFASNAWLQELPDPVTTLAWGNAAHVSVATARRLGVRTGDVIRVQRERATVDIPAFVVPGHANDVLTLHFGYGRTGRDTLADAIGVDVYPLWRGTGVAGETYASVARTGAAAALAITQTHRSLDAHTPAHAMTLDQLRSAPDAPADPQPSLYEPPAAVPDPAADEQWAMTIDLSACIGCGACVIACQAENNVPVVGLEDVRKGRELHWLRIDRYAHAATDVTHTLQWIAQPMLCQHCEMAPCEYVCPVEATVHSPDGLNEMVYNRCVGTRFCSNNCPYKVRRFNWFDYNADVGPVAALARNPDVTVRARGVMEKCTFCVQRIRGAQSSARVEGRALRTDEVRTACQQACPAGAIVFGSLSDPDSAVWQGRQGPRSYEALGELGTRPRVRYLARVRNPNPALETTT